MKEINEKVNELRSMVEDEIAHILIKVYKNNHSGLLPNWEDDEEIVVSNDEVGTFNLTIKENNTYDEDVEYNTYQIARYIVTLDSVIYFITDDEDEFDCSDIDTDTLINLLWYLKKKVN